MRKQPNFNPYGKKKPLSQIEASTLRVLSQTSEFMEALQSEVGRILFDDLVELTDRSLKAIYDSDGEIKESDKQMLKACKFIAGRWNRHIQNHIESNDKLADIQAIKNKKKTDNKK